MAQGRKSLLAGAERTGQVGKLGATSGGTDFLIARAGGGFTVPIRKAALASLANHRGDSLTEHRAKKEGNPFGSPNRNCEKLR
jgi:hypothetical protein